MRIRALALLLPAAFVACTHASREPSDADDARRRYFVERRAFPFDTIPPGARREAIEQWRRTRRVASDALPSWKPVGSGSLGVAYPYRSANGRVTAIAVSPADPRVVLIGASGGGILRSGDGGVTFVPVADDQYDLSVGDIAFASADVAYAGMGDSGLVTTLGTGLLRSDDAGRSWRHVSTDPLLERGAIRRLVVNPDDPENVWIVQEASLALNGGREVGGIFESKDGGRTSTRRMFGTAFGLIRINATTLVAGQTGRILRTIDGGLHWTSILRAPSAGDIYLAASPSDSSLITGVAIENKGLSNERTIIFVSRDAGSTWQTGTASGIDVDDFPYGYLTFSPDARTLFRGLKDLWRSDDGGAHWTNLTKDWNGGHFDASDATMHTDQHAIAFAGDGTAWLANDGGLYVSRDGVQHFTFAGPATTSLVQLYGLSAHPLDPARLYGATQDNGLLTYRTGGRWAEARSGDYGSVLFDLPHARILTNYIYGNLLQCDLDGLHCGDPVADNAEFGEPKDNPRIAFIAPLVLNATTRAVYFGTWKLWVSNDFGSNWHTTAATDLTRGGFDSVSAIGITEANAAVIYTGSWQGRVMRSADGGNTWSDVTGALPLRAVSAIVTSGDGTTAWVGFSGYHSGHIYRTTDGGATWERIDAGLPDLPVDTLFLDGTTLWAGTDAGAFRLGDDGMWQAVSGGMPPVIVMAFTRTADGRLLAATHGRGVYELVPAAEAPPRRRSSMH